MNYELARKNLAEYLGVEVEDCEIKYDQGESCEIDTPEGEYLVCNDYDTARELAVEGARNVLDDIGLEGLTPSYRDYVLSNSDFFEQDWFEDAERESFGYYVDDIEDESSSEYENRLVEEMYDDGVISDSDLHEDEDGLLCLNEDLDIDDLKEQFIQNHMDTIDDFAQYFIDEYGEREFEEVVKQKNLADYDAIAEDIIDTDGNGLQLASYDSDEHELADGMYAYRIN